MAKSANTAWLTRKHLSQQYKMLIRNGIRYTGSVILLFIVLHLLGVKIKTFDNQYIRIPNEKLLGSELTNITRFEELRHAGAVIPPPALHISGQVEDPEPETSGPFDLRKYALLHQVPVRRIFPASRQDVLRAAAVLKHPHAAGGGGRRR